MPGLVRYLKHIILFEKNSNFPSNKYLPVIMPPCELFLNVSFGFQRLESFDNLQIGDGFQFRMFRGMVVFFGYQNTLFEEVFIDSNSVLFGHQHPKRKTVISH